MSSQKQKILRIESNTIIYNSTFFFFNVQCNPSQLNLKFELSIIDLLSQHIRRNEYFLKYYFLQIGKRGIIGATIIRLLPHSNTIFTVGERAGHHCIPLRCIALLFSFHFFCLTLRALNVWFHVLVSFAIKSNAVNYHAFLIAENSK